MMFLTKKNKKKIEIGDREVVLVVGGTGVLGKAFIGAMPEDFFIVNVSKNSLAEGEHVVNFMHDITAGADVLVAHMKELVPRIDVLINMAYSKEFSSIPDFSKDRFLREMTCDVVAPIELSLHCGTHFWSRSSQEENRAAHRKVINISSGASFGKTQRPELATYSSTKSSLNIMTEYLHEHLFTSYGVSAHIIAPGALSNTEVLQRTVEALWKLIPEATTNYSLQRIG